MPEWAWLSLGSNVDRHRNLCAGLDALLDKFGALTASSVYESAAVGFAGDPFFNLAVGIETALEVGAISEVLRDIENRFGRDRSQPRFSDRTLDIDLLMLGQRHGDHDGICLPRPETTQQPFVLVPLAEIAPELNIPLLNQKVKNLCKTLGHAGLEAVPFRWQGQDLSGITGAKRFPPG